MISGKMKLLSAVVGAAALVATPALASKTNKKRYQVSPNANASQIQRGFDVNAVYSWGWQISRLRSRPKHSLSVDAGPKLTTRLIPSDSNFTRRNSKTPLGQLLQRHEILWPTIEL